MKLSRTAKFREERFGGVLFETKTEKVFALNPTAAAVVREINGGAADEAALIDRMSYCFHDSRHTIEQDVRALVADLRRKGLIEE